MMYPISEWNKNKVVVYDTVQAEISACREKKTNGRERDSRPVAKWPRVRCSSLSAVSYILILLLFPSFDHERCPTRFNA